MGGAVLNGGSRILKTIGNPIQTSTFQRMLCSAGRGLNFWDVVVWNLCKPLGLLSWCSGLGALWLAKSVSPSLPKQGTCPSHKQVAWHRTDISHSQHDNALRPASQPASKQASKQATKQASKQASKQATKYQATQLPTYLAT